MPLELNPASEYFCIQTDNEHLMQRAIPLHLIGKHIPCQPRNRVFSQLFYTSNDRAIGR